MPIYEYTCNDCNHRLEALQALNEAPLEVCPKCGHNSLSKNMSLFGARMKGASELANLAKTSAGTMAKAMREPNPSSGCGHCADTPSCQNHGFASRMKQYEKQL